jgi:hypothetical protein
MVRRVDIMPYDIAIALSIVEGDIYNHILPADYIAHLLRLSTPNIEAAYDINNKIGFWVKKSILRPDRIESRGEALKFFVNVADVSNGYFCPTLL